MLICSALIGACATYTAAPVDVHDVADVQRGRALQMDAVDAELARIAPDYGWQGGEWNPLTLL
ncbi:MAG: hypothetical protein WB812_00360, partial [Woeseiaceae bacterium]